MDIQISKEILKNCDTILKKNKIKQCKTNKPVCLVLQGLLSKVIKKNRECKDKKQKINVVKVQKQVYAKQQSIKKQKIKVARVQKQVYAKQQSIKNQDSSSRTKILKEVSLYYPPTVVKKPIIKQQSIKKQDSSSHTKILKELSLYYPPTVVKKPIIKQQSINLVNLDRGTGTFPLYSPPVKTQSIKKQTSLSPPSYEQVTNRDKELIKNYITATFKKEGINFKSCEDIGKYKEDLRKKCIKFLGYDSPAKTSECAKFRFRKFLKNNSKLQYNLTNFGCSIDI